MKAVMAILVAATLSLASGCSERSASAAGNKTGSTASTASAIALAITEGRASTACLGASSDQSPESVVALTAKQCLSCIDVGSLLRQAQRDAKRDQKDLRVAVASDEAEEVCAFMQREKVRLPVLAIPKDEFPRGETVGELLYFEATPDGKVARLEVAPTGEQLLEKMRGRSDASSPGARP